MSGITQQATCAAETPPAVEPRSSFAPPTGTTLLFIGQDLESIDAYVRATKDAPAGLMVYTSIQRLEGLEHPADPGGGIQHARALIARYPNTVLQVGLWMVGGLGDVANGVYDAKIARLGRFLQQADRPVYLRIGYEFDLPENHYDPSAYIWAFRHIVQQLRRQGVENVAFVWHSFASRAERPVIEWYPGDAYVDWFAITYFDQDRSDLEPMAKLAREHGKLLMIAEATPRGIGAREAKLWGWWFGPFARFIHEERVQAVCYINADWDAHPMFHGQGWQDSRVQVNPEVQAAWLAEITQPAYLHASPTLYEQLGYTPHRHRSRPSR